MKTDYNKTILTLLFAQWVFMLGGIFGLIYSSNITEYIVSGGMIYGSMNFHGLSLHYKKQLVKDTKKTFGVAEDVWNEMTRRQKRKFARDVKSGKIEIKKDENK